MLSARPSTTLRQGCWAAIVTLVTVVILCSACEVGVHQSQAMSGRLPEQEIDRPPADQSSDPDSSSIQEAKGLKDSQVESRESTDRSGRRGASSAESESPSANQENVAQSSDGKGLPVVVPIEQGTADGVFYWAQDWTLVRVSSQLDAAYLSFVCFEGELLISVDLLPATINNFHPAAGSHVLVFREVRVAPLHRLGTSR